MPCYVDQLFPHVGVATVELLERFDMVVELPDGPTCCGQPMANTGCTQDAAPLAEQFLQVYQDYAYVVCPSCCFGRNLRPIANHWRQSNGIILLVRADKSWLGQHRPQLGCQSGVGKEVSSNMMIVFDHLCAIRFILQHSRTCPHRCARKIRTSTSLLLPVRDTNTRHSHKASCRSFDNASPRNSRTSSERAHCPSDADEWETNAHRNQRNGPGCDKHFRTIRDWPNAAVACHLLYGHERPGQNATEK